MAKGNRLFRRDPRNGAWGFTLIELLTAIALTIVILALLTQMIAATSAQWKRSNEGTKAFESARAAFDVLTRNLSQATLGTFYEYYDSQRIPYPLAANAGPGQTNLSQVFVPSDYGRYSYLHFVTGTNLVPDQITHSAFFQAPLDFVGTGSAESAAGQLNAIGYYVAFTNDLAQRPAHLPPGVPQVRNRFRLMECLQPTDELEVYRLTNRQWISNSLTEVRPFAENILCLVLWPKNPSTTSLIAPGFGYDSRTNWAAGITQPVQMHQLPPVVKVMMVAIDESSARRLDGSTNFTENLFRDPDAYDADRGTLESRLIQANITYKIFQTEIPIRAAKWSE